jgi:multiple sugar transport system permease protein
MGVRRFRVSHIIIYGVFIFFTITQLFPAVFMLLTSFFHQDEILYFYGAGGTSSLRLIPYQLSLAGYFEVFLGSPNYLMRFWISLFLTGTIVLGQVLISCLAGYGFSKFNFPFKNVFFFIVIILMLLPLQVTLVPQFFALSRMGLIDTYPAVILPGIFAPFGIFLITQVFLGVPKEIMDAAKIDGAGHLTVLFRVVMPIGRAGVASLVVLAFIDNWSMVEQPLFFLGDPRMHPMSIFLSYIDMENLWIVFVCAVLSMLPVFLLYLYFNKELMTGIEISLK